MSAVSCVRVLPRAPSPWSERVRDCGTALHSKKTKNGPHETNGPEWGWGWGEGECRVTAQPWRRYVGVAGAVLEQRARVRCCWCEEQGSKGGWKRERECGQAKQTDERRKGWRLCSRDTP
jgi:hypothetical protein